MGGDFGPSVVIPAALEALSNYQTLRLILVGKLDQMEAQFRLMGKEISDLNPRLTIVDAPEVVKMDDPPALALRQKKASSMRMAINLVKNGEAQACVSAGNTGALMAIARFVLKTIPGIDRPAIVYSLPSQIGQVHVLDLGANVDCRPEDLFQFAVMGSVLATAVANNPCPKVALLNVGSEAIKGSEQVKRAAEILSQSGQGLNYIGFVEGDDIYKGTADVVVCDGFVGNVALKTSEGLAKMIIRAAKEEFMRHWYSKLAALLAAPVLKRLHNRLDPGKYNGASLLGLRGIVIKSHGNADIKAFTTAIGAAMIEAEKNVPEKIASLVAAQLGDKVST
jgi:glycerol-3-phosphate acyltransferase PlsX